MKRLRWVAAVLALTMLTCLTLSGCQERTEPELTDTDRTEAVDGNWLLTREWTVERAENGAETLTVAAAMDSTAWNQFFSLYDDWAVAIDITLVQPRGDVDCLRMLFGDIWQNVCLAVSLEYSGANRAALRVDQLTEGGWRSLLEAEEPVAVGEGPMRLAVERKNGADTLAVSLAQGDTTLFEGKTGALTQRTLSMIRRVGLGVYGSEAVFSDLTVRAAPNRRVDVSQAVTIETGEHVETDEWLMGPGAVHNLVNDGSAIVVDGEGETYAWNIVNTLEGEWTLTFKVEYGKSYRDSCCARIMFGPEIGENYTGLVTLNYANGGVLLETQNKVDGIWENTGTSMQWRNVPSKEAVLQISKYPGMNRLEVKVLAQGNEVVSLLSDEIEQEQMADYRSYGVMAYSSQVRFSEMTFAAKAASEELPEVIEVVAPVVNELTIGTPISTGDWTLPRGAAYFRENGAPAMVLDSKGEQFAYYKKNTLGDNWSVSTQIEFGKYYASTATARLALADVSGKLGALVTVKYSPADNTIMLEAQYISNDKWTSLTGGKWSPGSSTVRLEVSGSKNGMEIAVKGPDGSVITSASVKELPGEVAGRLQTAGLAVYATQVKYSDIQMKCSGPAPSAVEAPGGDETGSGETAYASISPGTAQSTQDWKLDSGAVYSLENGKPAVFLDGRKDQNAYYTAKTLGNSWSVSAKVAYGACYSESANARVAFTDRDGSMAALVTLKYAKNDGKLRLEVQSNDGSSWHNVVSPADWKSGGHTVLLTVSGTAAGKLSVTVNTLEGSVIHQVNGTVPTKAAERMEYAALAVNTGKVKFTDIRMDLAGGAGSFNGGVSSGGSGESSESNESGGSNEAKAMIPLEIGPAAETARWSKTRGITYTQDGSLVIKWLGDVYSYDQQTTLEGGFSISTDVHFGEMDDKGTCTARIALTDGERNLAVLFTIKFSENFEVMVEGQYTKDGSWSSILSDNKWRSVSDNRIKATVSRREGAGSYTLTLTDSTGKRIYSAETAAVADEVNSAVAAFGLGSNNSQVKFSNISVQP